MSELRFALFFSCSFSFCCHHSEYLKNQNKNIVNDSIQICTNCKLTRTILSAFCLIIILICTFSYIRKSWTRVLFSFSLNRVDTIVVNESSYTVLHYFTNDCLKPVILLESWTFFMWVSCESVEHFWAHSSFLSVDHS